MADETTTPGTEGQTEDAPAQDTRTYSQADVDRIIADRLARQKWQFEEERKKAALSETERLKAEKDEATKAADTRVRQANERIVRAEARAQLAESGVKPERIAYAVKLLELGGISVSDDGEADAKAVKAEVTRLLKEFPELGGEPAPKRAGTEVKGDGSAASLNDRMNDAIRRAAGRG